MGFLRRHGTGSRDRLAEKGLEATAVVRSVEKTRARENADGPGRSSPVYEYRLLVTLPAREPYEVVHRQTGWPEQGRTVVVRVDPEDHENLRIDWAATKEQEAPQAPTLTDLAAPDTVWMPGAPAARPEPPRDPASILATGAPGSATVVNTSRGGGTAPGMGDPVHWFLLEVRTGPGGPTFLVELEEGVPPAKADLVATGAELPVRVIATTAAGVAIDWGAA